MAPRILIVEDDERIRTATKLALEEEGYAVDEAASGEDAYGAFDANHPDVVLIDVMLPGADGFEVCRRLRESSDVPIIMVTALGDTQEVINGLEAGADDYVRKPFASNELAARIRALLRRASTTEGNRRLPAIIKFGNLELSPEAGVVRKDGEVVHLTKTEFRLLCELAANPGRVLSRDELLDRVWSYDYFGDGRLVDVHVRRLRSKIEPDAADPTHIVTVRGLGYKLEQ